jgi:hypothetical protein
MKEVREEMYFVVLKFNDGRYKIEYDWGDYAWGSPAYEVVDYFTDYSDAKKAVTQDRKGTTT